MIKKFVSLLVTLALVSALLPVTFAAVPTVTALSVSPSSFDPSLATADITFSIDNSAYVSAYIMNGSTEVRRMFLNAYRQAGKYYSPNLNLNWDGRNNDGQLVSPGTYTVKVEARETTNSGPSIKTVSVTVLSSIHADITSLTLSKYTFDPDTESTTIDFSVATAAYYNLYVYCGFENTYETRDIMTERYLSAGSYSYNWNGKKANGSSFIDNDCTVILDGKNTYGGNAVESKIASVTLDYNSNPPSVSSIGLSRSTFDPDEGTVISFVNYDDAYLDLYITNASGSTVRTFNDYNSDFYNENTDHDIVWYGDYNSGTDLPDGTYIIKLEASNVEGTTYKNQTVFIDDDGSEGNFVSGLTLDPSSNFYPQDYNNLEIEFDIEEDLDQLKVWAIRGSTEVEIYDNNDVDARNNMLIYWSGRDDDDDYVDSGTWKIQVEAEVDGDWDIISKNITIGGGGGSSDCGGFSDVDEDSIYCDAIEWTKNEGIFQGYSDGRFRPYNDINRVELLKVVLEFLDVDLLSANGSSLGFTDVEPWAWYMTYIRTAQSLGIFSGDGGTNTARPADTVNRAETLKIVFEALHEVEDLDINNCSGESFRDVYSSDWFWDYACMAEEYGLYEEIVGTYYMGPAVGSSRAEVAYILYKLHLEDVL